MLCLISLALKGRSSKQITALLEQGDYSPVNYIISKWMRSLPHFKGKKGEKILEEFAAKNPHKVVESCVSLMKLKPEYANSSQKQGTTNIQVVLDGMAYSQKEKLLLEKLKELGMSRDQLEAAFSVEEEDVKEARQDDNNSRPAGEGKEERPAS